MARIIKYRTFDELLTEVKSDFPLMDQDGMIDPQDYIKHAKYINARLGIKIRTNKQRIIEIRNGRGKLPSDLEIFNYGAMLMTHTEIIPMGHADHVVALPPANYTDPLLNICFPENPNLPLEELPLTQNCGDSCSGCHQTYNKCYCVPSEYVKTNCKGDKLVVLREYKNHKRVYENLIPMDLVNSPLYTDDYCFKRTFRKGNELTIRDGYIFSAIENGNLYINYEGMLEDMDGNLLVLDHDLINMYYEYYLKSKCLENAHARNYPVNPNLEQRIEMNLRKERIAAESLVNMLEFQEISKAHKLLRKAFYVKYYRMFSSH